MRRSDLFGFTPGGQVLDAEEAYGFVPGGQVFDAEVAYGDEYGGDLDDVPLFGGHDGGDDDPDDALDQIMREMDQDDDGDDEYGEDPLEASVDGSGARQQLGQIISDGAREALFGMAEKEPRIMKLVQGMGEKYANLLQPGDLEEIAQAMMADPAFSQWNQLSDDQRTALVHSAIAYAAVPGIEMNWDDEFSRKWDQGGWTSVPGDIYSAARVFVAGDLGKQMYASLAELPITGAAMQQLGWDPENADQVINARAMCLYLLGMMWPVDATIAANITDDGQSVIQAVGRGRAEPVSATVILSEEVLASSIPLPEPAQQLADVGIGLPEPQQILAIGYGIAIGGSILGIFR